MPGEPDWDDPATYSAGPGRMLGELLSSNGSVEAQHRVLAELAAYARADQGMYAPTTALPGEVSAAFHDGLREVVPLLDPDVLLRHPGLLPELRLGLFGLRTGEAVHGPATRRPDPGRGLDRISYLVAGPLPSGRGDPGAVHQKLRSIEFIGSSIASERILWVPTGTDVTIAGSRLVDVPREPEARRSAFDKIRNPGRSLPDLARTVVHDRALRRRADLPDVASRFADAWLLMDRDTAAQDNAEHLYRYLKTYEPDINAFFVLGRTSRDWSRLEAEGFRLIAFGSDDYYLALLHCAHLVSSQVDGYVVRPFTGHALGPQLWRYTFLQHGVITQDLSRWLNIKPIDLIVTTTPTEQRSIAGDGTPYVLTDLEAVQVGLARHDRLVHLGATAPKRRLLVTPTWRSELLGEQTGSNRRALLPDFWTSRYATAWTDLLASPEIAALCDEAGWELTFMPHPNMQDYLATSPLPAHVTTLRFDEVDVQQIFAEAALWVTDYSSLGTEAAVLECPVVYFQFDQDEFYRGRLYQQSSWSYTDDGYGPLTRTQPEAIAALRAIAADGPAELYLERMRSSVPLRDGHNCQRTVAAIRAINSPQSSR